MSVANRMRQSLTEYGIKRTVQTVASIIADHSFDWRYGTDTVQEAHLNNLKVSKPAFGALDYQPSRTPYFRRLLKRVTAPRGSTFVDLGAGKCRTLLLAADYGYRKVVGVEFSEELCITALRNIENFRRKTAVSAQFQVIRADVAEYSIGDDANVLYVSAFAEATLQRILQNIVTSLQRAPRQLTLISHNPYCPGVIERNGRFTKVEQFVFGSETATIFQSRPN